MQKLPNLRMGFTQRRKLAALMALLGGALHFVFLAWPFLRARGVGEAAGWPVLIFDFPLVWLQGAGGRWFPALWEIGFSLVYYPVCGTAMYAAAGALIGWVMGSFRARRQRG